MDDFILEDENIIDIMEKMIKKYEEQIEYHKNTIENVKSEIEKYQRCIVMLNNLIKIGKEIEEESDDGSE